MIAFLFGAALATAPAPTAPADQHKGHAEHQGMKDECCKMDCCKDKKMPCCDKSADKKADAPAAAGHGGHEHDH